MTFTFMESCYVKFYNLLRRVAAIDGKEKVTDIQSFYDIDDIDHKKNIVSMEKFRGKVLLVINVTGM